LFREEEIGVHVETGRVLHPETVVSVTHAAQLGRDIFGGFVCAGFVNLRSWNSKNQVIIRQSSGMAFGLDG